MYRKVPLRILPLSNAITVQMAFLKKEKAGFVLKNETYMLTEHLLCPTVSLFLRYKLNQDPNEEEKFCRNYILGFEIVRLL